MESKAREKNIYKMNYVTLRMSIKLDINMLLYYHIEL